MSKSIHYRRVQRRRATLRTPERFVRTQWQRLVWA